MSPVIDLINCNAKLFVVLIDFTQFLIEFLYGTVAAHNVFAAHMGLLRGVELVNLRLLLGSPGIAHGLVALRCSGFQVALSLLSAHLSLLQVVLGTYRRFLGGHVFGLCCLQLATGFVIVLLSLCDIVLGFVKTRLGTAHLLGGLGTTQLLLGSVQLLVGIAQLFARGGNFTLRLGHLLLCALRVLLRGGNTLLRVGHLALRAGDLLLPHGHRLCGWQPG